MAINSVNNVSTNRHVSFGAHTEKGNAYSRAVGGYSVGAIAGLTVAGYNVYNEHKSGIFKELTKTQTAMRAGKIFAILVGVGIAFGLIQDAVVNKMRRKKADKNDGTEIGKFAHTIESPKYSKKYDAKLDAVLVERIAGSDFTSYKINAEGTVDKIEGKTGRSTQICEFDKDNKRIFDIIKTRGTKRK